MKYQFIQAQQREFRVTRLCQVLQVSRSGFYAWQRRPESALIDRMRVLHR